MKIFVTGATGFVGIHLCKRLIEEGHHVVALVRSAEKRMKLPEKNLEIIQGDLALFKDQQTELPECEVVIHLAAVIKAIDDADYYTFNYEGVKDLVACLQRQKWRPGRIVFASSIAAAGPALDGVPLTETMPLQPIEVYGASKKMAEDFLSTINIPTTCFRPPTIYGPGDDKLLTLFKMANRGMGIKVAGNNQLLSFIYVADLVDAILKMAVDKSDIHQTYFVGYKEYTDINTIWSTLGHTLDKKIWLISIPKSVLFVLTAVLSAISSLFKLENQLDWTSYKQMTAKAFISSSSKLQQELDWHPQYNLADTMSATAAGYKAVGWL